MEMEKKNLAIIILAVVLGASGVGNVFLLVEVGLVEVTPPKVENIIIAGMMYGPDDVDPQFLWESAGFDVAMQVYESLYAYNLSDPNLGFIPRLASDFGTWNGNNFTIPLRTGVTFHDGTQFNATAVKWSWDRLLYWTNSTGALPDTESETDISVLYRWPNGTAIIKEVHVDNNYQVTFELNGKIGIFEALLTFSGSFIMAPSQTPFYEKIETADAVSLGEADPAAGKYALCGTGAFVFDKYITGYEVRFSRYDDYWQGPAQLDKLVFAIIQDSDARNLAMLAGDTNLLESPHPSWYDEMRDADAAGTMTFYEPDYANSITSYLGMNNKLLNITWRKAISYAINYTYMIDELLEGEAQRMGSPIPEGIAFANYSFDYATYELTKARGYMQDMGFGVTFTTENDWKTASFKTINYTYNLGNKFREDMLILLTDNLELIGITVEDAGMEWGPYLGYAYNRTAPGYNALMLWWIGWIPDYNDPSNYVNSLMSNASSSNAAQINDPYLEQLMEDGLVETDPAKREIIYDELQRYCVEELYPWAWGYNAYNRDAWMPNVHGFPSNPWGYSYFYPCYIE